MQRNSSRTKLENSSTFVSIFSLLVCGSSLASSIIPICSRWAAAIVFLGQKAYHTTLRAEAAFLDKPCEFYAFHTGDLILDTSYTQLYGITNMSCLSSIPLYCLWQHFWCRVHKSLSILTCSLLAVKEDAVERVAGTAWIEWFIFSEYHDLLSFYYCRD